MKVTIRGTHTYGVHTHDKGWMHMFSNDLFSIYLCVLNFVIRKILRQNYLPASPQKSHLVLDTAILYETWSILLCTVYQQDV